MMIIQNSESIDYSLTFTIFQELVLGSEIFEQAYGQPSQLGQESYLNSFDRSNIKPSLREKLIAWSDHPLNGAAIMTNRPSNSLLGLPGTPEAELGAALVGLDYLPVIGAGEMRWLANRFDEDVRTLLKPSSYHALSAILAASGLPADDSLLKAHQIISGKSSPRLSYLDQCTIYIFEDTPGGILATDNAREILLTRGVNIQVRKLGITKDPSKRKSLVAIGSEVFDSVDLALQSIDSFNNL
ncbi:MAG: hypothetical protein ISS57_00325 [Anaerolineales bacterium]|nr:hypothetical protein [Anaerolineales bacterium]